MAIDEDYSLKRKRVSRTGKHELRAIVISFPVVDFSSDVSD